jgi:hypothetical protein
MILVKGSFSLGLLKIIWLLKIKTFWSYNKVL